MLFKIFLRYFKDESLFVFLGLSCNVESEKDNISIEDYVILTILFVQTCSFNLLLTSEFFKIREFHDFSTDESLFEISMDNTSSSWGFGTISHGPALNFISSCSEVMNKLEISISSLDNSINH